MIAQGCLWETDARQLSVMALNLLSVVQQHGLKVFA